MPRQHFRTGYPRKGQWVQLEGDLTLRTSAGELELKGGLIGIATKPHGKDELKAVTPELVFVDIVDQDTGLETVARFLLPLEQLVPVLERTRIPGPRLERADPSWNPSA